MFVLKRNGSKERVQFDKVLDRVIGTGDRLKVDAVAVAQKVVSGLFDGISSKERGMLMVFWTFRFLTGSCFDDLSVRFDPQAKTLSPRALFSIFFAAFSSAFALK